MLATTDELLLLLSENKNKRRYLLYFGTAAINGFCVRRDVACCAALESTRVSDILLFVEHVGLRETHRATAIHRRRSRIMRFWKTHYAAMSDIVFAYEYRA